MSELKSNIPKSNIKWVSNKQINQFNIIAKINQCLQTKHFTNGGKNVSELQNIIKQVFQIDKDKEVLLTCNGAMGLQALIGGFNIHNESESSSTATTPTSILTSIRWAVQSFTFPCSNQGVLQDSIVFDVDNIHLGPDLIQLTENIDKYDGIIITNCFGACVNIQVYEDFCKTHNKLLVFDNAAAPFSVYKGKNHLNYGNACMVSLHHTKPIGFGEGGFIIFDKKYKEAMERAICFGFTSQNRNQYSRFAGNYKMSEIAAIYITEYLYTILSDNDYLFNNGLLFAHHRNIVQYFTDKLKEFGLQNKIALFSNFADNADNADNNDNTFLSTIPIMFLDKIARTPDKFIEYGIEAKKYYYPLHPEKHINAIDWYNQIICLPLNIDVNITVIDDLYIPILLEHYV